MNQTTEGSKKFVTIVGGDTVVKETGKIEMPPEQSLNVEKIVDNIIAENYIVISMENCKAEDILNKKQIEQLSKNRETRKTNKALLRKLNREL